MCMLVNNEIAASGRNSEGIYAFICSSVITAQDYIYISANTAMATYREIDGQIYNAYGENCKAKYGKK